MAVRSYKSLTSHLPQQKSTGLTKYVRQNFVVEDSKRCLPPIRDIIATRNERVYREKPVDCFHENYKRRQENMTKGHFSVDCQPYKTMGGDTILLDPRDIILHVFADKLAGIYMQKLKDSFDKENAQKKFIKEVESEESVHMEPMAPICNIFPRTVLWSFIKEAEVLMWKVKSNSYQFYEELVQSLLDEKYTEVIQAELQNPMVLKTLSGLMATGTDTPPSSRPDSPEPDNDLVPEEESHESVVDGNNDVISSYSSTSAATRNKNRKKCNHLKMLQFLYKVLDWLCNMQNKWLKYKTPIPREVLTSLMSENRYTTTRGGGRITSLDVKDPRYQRDGFVVSPTQTGSIQINAPIGQSKILGKGTSSGLGTSSQTARTSSPRNRVSTPKAVCVQIETWDDLMALHDRQQKGSTATRHTVLHPDGGSHLYNTRDFHYMSARSAGQVEEKASTINANVSMKPEFHRKPAIWQTLMTEKLSPVVDTSSDEKLVPRARFAQLGSKGKNALKLLEKEPEMRMRKIAKNFRTSRDVMEKEFLYVLQKLDRKKISSYRFKMATLRHLTPLDFYEKHRLYVKQLDLGADPADKVETEQCTWMMKLIRDTSRISRKDAQIQDMVQRLSRFSYVDTTTPSYGRAKLCLLIMSLPANQLCEIHAQTALKFVTEDVLLCSKGVFKRWMEHRRIPSVIEAPLSTSFTN